MKQRTSLRGQVDRDKNSYLVNREGVCSVRNKEKGKFKVKQKNTKKKRKLKLR